MIYLKIRALDDIVFIIHVINIYPSSPSSCHCHSTPDESVPGRETATGQTAGTRASSQVAGPAAGQTHCQRPILRPVGHHPRPDVLQTTGPDLYADGVQHEEPQLIGGSAGRVWWKLCQLVCRGKCRPCHRDFHDEQLARGQLGVGVVHHGSAFLITYVIYVVANVIVCVILVKQTSGGLVII